MGLMLTGIGVNFLATLFFKFTLPLNEYYQSIAESFTLACMIFWPISLIGTIFILNKKYKLGMILVTIGSFIFIPAGLIAIIGANQVYEKKASQPNLAKRRQFYKENNDA